MDSLPPWDWSRRVLKTRRHEVRVSLEPAQFAFRLFPNLSFGVRTPVGEPLILQSGPDHFIEIHFKGIGMEPTSLEPFPMVTEELLHAFLSVDRSVVPEQRDPTQDFAQ